MKIQWIPTNEIYHAIINAQTLSEKQALYRQKVMHPWQQMMQMMSGQAINPDDEFAGARAWAWHTPDELDDIPQALTQLEVADAWQLGENALKKGVAAFADYDLPFDTVEGWLMLGVPERNPSHESYTGAIDFTHPRFVCQYFEPDEHNIKALSGAVVHEFNHLVRLRVQPWDMMTTTVSDYIIHEGIAESFATALFGEEVLGYYVTDINDADLAIAKQIISENLQMTGFNVIRGYIFGDHLAEQWGFEKIGMPNFGGYAVGFHVVQAFLKKTGMSVQEATFLPAEQIIAESGYFD
ncbi:MAG: DUF2268 domain-containing putative Zn-dependent protease [Chloroflexota bacterium]